MPNVFTLIGDSWSFYRKQPVLSSVIFWLYIVPGSLMNMLITLLAWMPENRWDVTALAFGIMLILMIVTIWGSACVLLVARRTVKTSVGRTRTSFQTLRLEASALIVPLLLTGILQACITLLWSLLLIVPGIVYQIRTSFYPVIIAAEGTQYRAALHRSKDVITGQTWQALGYILALAIILYLPINLLSFTGWAFVAMSDIRWTFAIDILDAALSSIATTLFLIALTSLYGIFQKNSQSATS